MGKVLAIAVHPDDETLGCGGTLLRHKANGDEIYWLIITGMHQDHGFSTDQIQKREEEIKAVTDLYGFNKLYRLDVPAGKVDQISIDELVQKISDVFNDLKPETVYLPFRGDVHSDHRKLFEAAYSCTKTFRYPFIKKVLMMETISETDFAPTFEDNVFLPNYFVDVSDYLDDKLKIMTTYKSEMGEHPFPRNVENIKALATYRGSMANCKYAESFMTLKERW